MSLLQKQTSTLLGIGPGTIRDFAAGVRTRKKQTPGVTREEALAMATANEGQDERLRAQGDIRPTADPKLTHGNRLNLTEDDRALIESIQSIGATVTSMMAGARIGEGEMARWRARMGNFLDKAENSSRLGLAEVWAPVYQYMEAGMTGKRLVGAGEVGEFHKRYYEALGKTNRVLDTALDTSTYEFLPGRTERLTGYKQHNLFGKVTAIKEADKRKAYAPWEAALAIGV